MLLARLSRRPQWAVALARRGLCSLPPHSLLPMPALSPTMTSGNLAAWKKAEGDAINVGDVIAEIETDKATVDYESQDDGFLAKIIMPEGCARAPGARTPIGWRTRAHTALLWEQLLHQHVR